MENDESLENLGIRVVNANNAEKIILSDIQEKVDQNQKQKYQDALLKLRMTIKRIDIAEKSLIKLVNSPFKSSETHLEIFNTQKRLEKLKSQRTEFQNNVDRLNRIRENSMAIDQFQESFGDETTFNPFSDDSNNGIADSADADFSISGDSSTLVTTSDYSLQEEAFLDFNDDFQKDHYTLRLQKWKMNADTVKCISIPNAQIDSSSHNENQLLKCPYSLWKKLFSYQQTCIKWLYQLHLSKCGGILADEQGLGKTIQIISFLAILYFNNISNIRNRSILIVSPATVVEQWLCEFHKWWPPWRILLFHGSNAKKNGYKKILQISRNGGCIVITTYQSLRIYQDLLCTEPWLYAILDEGHKIRNPEAGITIAAKSLRTAHRLMLTGSPIQNNLTELWSLFDFCYPGKLGTLSEFTAEFVIPISIGGYSQASSVQVRTAYACAVALRKLVKPYLIRRTKNTVKTNLPEKTEKVLFIQLEPIQREYYQSYLDSPAFENILSRKTNCLYAIDILRRICNHPLLLHLRDVPMKSKVADPVSIRSKRSRNGNFSFRPESKSPSLSALDFSSIDSPDSFSQLDSIPVTRKQLPALNSIQNFIHLKWAAQVDTSHIKNHWEYSCKLKVVSVLFRKWKIEGHKVLLFTQTRQMLDILEMFVQDEEYSYLRLDGNTPVPQRQTLIHQYNNSPNIFCFLLTTRVGGLGTNLTGANRIIIYDPDWNPSTDSQARERAWRIGQTRDVTVYRLMTAGTIEEKIFHRQVFKQYLMHKILSNPRHRRFLSNTSFINLFTLDPPVSSSEPTISSVTASDTRTKDGTCPDTLPSELEGFDQQASDLIEKRKKPSNSLQSFHSSSSSGSPSPSRIDSNLALSTFQNNQQSSLTNDFLGSTTIDSKRNSILDAVFESTSTLESHDFDKIMYGSGNRPIDSEQDRLQSQKIANQIAQKAVQTLELSIAKRKKRRQERQNHQPIFQPHAQNISGWLVDDQNSSRIPSFVETSKGSTPASMINLAAQTAGRSNSLESSASIFSSLGSGSVGQSNPIDPSESETFSNIGIQIVEFLKSCPLHQATSKAIAVRFTNSIQNSVDASVLRKVLKQVARLDSSSNQKLWKLKSHLE